MNEPPLDDDRCTDPKCYDTFTRLRQERDEAITASNIMAKSFKLAVEQRDEARKELVKLTSLLHRIDLDYVAYHDPGDKTRCWDSRLSSYLRGAAGAIVFAEQDDMQQFVEALTETTDNTEPPEIV